MIFVGAGSAAAGPPYRAEHQLRNKTAAAGRATAIQVTPTRSAPLNVDPRPTVEHTEGVTSCVLHDEWGFSVTVIPIRQLGDPVLREPAKPVTTFDDDLDTLVRDLRNTLSDSGGAGLAAPQLGVGLRVFVWAPALSDSDLDHLVNPVVDFPDEHIQDGPEGCLSIPGIYLDTRRRMNVAARGFTRQGDPVQVVGDGMLARCIQHETDHLDGVLFIDRLSPTQQERWVAALRAASWFDGSAAPAVKNSPHR